MDRIHQALHALPASGLRTGIPVVRMLVVVAGLRPAVQMQKQLFHTHALQAFHLFFPDGKQGDMVVFLRILFIKEIRFRIDVGLDAAVHDAAAYQIFYGRDSGGLFRKGNKQPGILHIASVNLAQVIIIAVLGKYIFHAAPVIHFPKARLPPCPDMGIRAARRMLQPRARIPGCGGNRNITCLILHLAVPGHIAPSRKKSSVKGKSACLIFPGVGDQKPLPFIYKRLPGLGRAVKFHASRPSHLFDGKPFFTNGYPFKMYPAKQLRRTSGTVLFHLLHPDGSLESIRILRPVQLPVRGTDSLSHAAFKRFMYNLLPARKINDLLLRHNDRAEVLRPFPFRYACLNFHMQRILIQIQCDSGCFCPYHPSIPPCFFGILRDFLPPHSTPLFFHCPDHNTGSKVLLQERINKKNRHGSHHNRSIFNTLRNRFGVSASASVHRLYII